MASLSTLPNELKLHILQRTPDLATLFALARTSSSFWHLYYQDRQSLTTTTAIAQLLDHGIDVMRPSALLAALLMGDHNRKIPDVTNLISRLQKQKSHNQPAKLSVKECIMVVLEYLAAADEPDRGVYRVDRNWSTYQPTKRSLRSEDVRWKKVLME